MADAGDEPKATEVLDLPEELGAAAEVLRTWSVEGPPRNPRASAAALLAQLEGARSATTCLVAEKSELRQRVKELMEQTEALQQEVEASRQHTQELEARLRAEGAAELAQVAAAKEAAEAACEALRALQGEREAMALEDLAAGAARDDERRAADARLRAGAAQHAAEAEAQRAENGQLRAQNTALCAQVREGMPPVTVMCRVRPVESYKGQDLASLRTALSIDVNEISLEDSGSRPRKFRVGRVLDGGVSQGDVFTAVAPLVECVSAGGYACIFAYGATGSGKTFTLQGGDGAGAAPGLAHHSVRRLVEGPGGGPVELAMLEVYCEQIRDLLAGANDAASTPPNVHCGRDGQGRAVLDCMRCTTSTFAEAEELLNRGYAARAAGGTLCNERSSRSHVVLFASATRLVDGAPANGGQLVLVDLAGSENIQRSGADEDSRLLAEAKAINKSLSALADVVEATAKRQQFVPYRNSRLTMLLEEALTQAKVLMMVHVSPLARDATDTGHSLNFAGRVQAVDFGAQRLRAEQEERLKSGMQRLRKEKEAAEGREAELRRQVEQLQARQREGAPERSGGPVARADETPGPQRRRATSAEQRPSRASMEPRSVAGRVPTPDPRGSQRARPLCAQPAEGESHLRQRQPTPMPSRRTCEALLAARDASDCEEQVPSRSPAKASADATAAGEALLTTPHRSRNGSGQEGGEGGTARVLSDITNLPWGGGSGAQEGKDAPPVKALFVAPSSGDEDHEATTPQKATPRRLSPASRSTAGNAGATEIWVDQELQGTDGASVEGSTVVGLKPALKKARTNFTQRMKDRLQNKEESTVKVRFDDDAPIAKSPPKWYLKFLAEVRQDEALARAAEEEDEASAAQGPGRSKLRRDAPPRRPREVRERRAAQDSQDSSCDAPRWRR